MNEKKYIIANWKMNKTPSESTLFMKELSKKLKNFKSTEVIICPSFLSISSIKELCFQSGIKIGAQNCHFEKFGAFTGEISSEMLVDVGAEYVIIGHSERREYFGETGEIINKKIKSALHSGLKVILCVGENREQRSHNMEFYTVKNQLREALYGIDSEKINDIIVAYEPIWAIGTGKTVTESDAVKMNLEIKNFISSEFKTNHTCPVLYGGSMNASNAEKFLKFSEIDGGLIGGASLKSDEFLKIINISESLSD